MNFPNYIASRYLFATKSHNAINIISAISVVCITIGTMALIIVLSVFNGFNDVISSHFNTFDPDIKITPATGKTFIPDSLKLDQLLKIKGVVAYSKTVEENVMLKYSDKQYIATIKGVDENYQKINGIDTMITEGEFSLYKENRPVAVVGQGIAYYLQIGLKFINPISIYVLNKDASYSANPMSAINQDYIYPSGLFSIEQETDAKYFIVPLHFALNLLGDSLSISALEVRTDASSKSDQIQTEIKNLMGPSVLVKNRFEQKELYYRIMKYEHWAIFLILSFILIIASFNVIGSLAVLIIEKKKDISTLHSMGADKRLISRIFQVEGLMITLFGGVAGLLLGLLVCWVQMKFGLIKLNGSGSFIIDAYPISVKLWDIVSVLITVCLIGFLASWLTVKYIIKQYLSGSSLKNQ